MASCGFPEPLKNAYIVHCIVTQYKYADAAKYLYALRRVSMNEWLVTVNELLKLSRNSRQLSTYASLIEVSKGSLLDEKAYLVPGLSEGITDRNFDYKDCLIFLKKIRSDYSL